MTLCEKSMNEDIHNPYSEIWSKDRNTVPFTSEDESTSELPLFALPPIIKEVIEGASESIGVSPALCFSMCLPCLSACCQHVVLIQNETKDTHLNMWVWSGAGSGERKSNTLKFFIKPLQEFESEANKRIKEIRQSEQAEEKILKAKYKRCESAVNKDDSTEAYAELQAVGEELAGFEYTPHCQLIIDDATTEASANIISENGGYGFIASTEARIYDIMAGRAYNNSVSNIDLYLKGFSNEGCRFNRKNSPPVFIEEPAISMCLSVQPEKLKQNLANDDFCDTGFVDRAVIILPESHFGKFEYRPNMILAKVVAEYENLIRGILQTRYDDDMRPAKRKYLRLTPAADEVFEQFFYIWWGRARIDLTDLKAFASKFFETVLRLAGIFQTVDNITSGMWADITKENAERAVIVGEYLAEQTIFVRRGGMKEKSDGEAAVLLDKMLKRLKKIQQTESGRTWLTYREDIQPHCKIAGKANRESLNPLLQELTNRNYISPPVMFNGNEEMQQDIESVERAKQYYINPQIIKEKA